MPAQLVSCGAALELSSFDPGSLAMGVNPDVSWYHVPYVGYVASLLGAQQKGTGTIIVACFLFGYAGWNIVVALRDRRRAQTTSEESSRDQAAARTLFTTRGYAQTSVADISRYAEVSVDTVYVSVGRKPQLLLAVAATRETQRVNAKSRYTENGPLATTRDLSKASAARRGGARPASAEEAAQRDARMSEMRRGSRSGRVVLCEGCGAAFCPLTGISRRRFCGMSCSNRATRNATLARQRAAAEAMPTT